MKRNPREIGVSLLLILTALLGLDCAQTHPLLAAFEKSPIQREALGPGTVFGSIDAAAVDALTFAYLQAQAEHDTERMRGGTIYPVDGRFTYGEIRVAGPLAPMRLRIKLKPGDAAWFLIYPQLDHYPIDRVNEQISPKDRRNVRFVDPLHRPLYILHPSLLIREYHGKDCERLEIADLRRPAGAIVIADD